MITINSCPVCANTSFEKHLNVTDHMITKERFNIVRCASCGFHFTNPRPANSDIAKYYKSEAYVSHSSSKKGVINYFYNLVRTKTLRQKLAWVKDVTAGNELLDIGCGTGHFLRVAKSKGFHGIGLEPDEDARNYAQEQNKVKSCPIQELYSLREDTFDVVTMWHVLEHVYNLNDDIQQIKRLLKNNGYLFVAVPNMNSYDARYYGEYWAAYDVPRHLYHFQKLDIERLFLNHGFELKKVIPMKYDSFYVSMLSEKYKGGNLLRAVFIGLLSNLKAKKHGFSSQVYVLRPK